MKAYLHILLALIFLVVGAIVNAGPIDTYEFDNQQTRERYQTLVKELRCPKCQNQNLADSNSQIAIDLRAKVYEMINDNKTDDQIIDFMVLRYGDFVLYSPKVNKQTYILWFGPLAAFIVGIFILILMLRKKKVSVTEPTLSADEHNKLQQILKDK